MAEIYLAIAEESEPRHQFAIKVIHQHNADDPDFVRMLVDEARLAVQLKHPNIVTTYDLGLANDQYYIVMEMVEGADLFRLQQRAADQRLSFPIGVAAYITREVAHGLDYAHRLCDSDGHPLQVVHRDISPQNVLLGYDGAVKITDFGIAKAERRAAQTQAGIIKGKYYYMSPEQASGQPIDGRTDIFAAGILLYEMLIGEMLYYDEDVERLLNLVRKADIPPVSKRRPDTPAALERILMKALRKNPAERYQTAAEYGQALDAYLRRYAPTVGASDVGSFLEKLVGERTRRRSAHEPTAALPVAGDAMGDGSADRTVGLTSEQIGQLGIRDENSLIFRPREQLAALLQGGSSGGELTSSSAGADGAAARDEEALIKTTQRQVEPTAPRRGSSSGTLEVKVPGQRAGAEKSSPPAPPAPRRSGDTTPVPVASPLDEPSPSSSSTRDAEPPGPPRRGRETLRGHSVAPRAPRDASSAPAEVFRAIEPDVEEELMAGAAAVAPAPYALTGSRRLSGSLPRHEPISAQLSNSEVTVPRAEVPPELLKALMSGVDERSLRPTPQAVPRQVATAEPSSKVELLQSDVAFSDASLVPVEPNVELSQHDGRFTEPRPDKSESTDGRAPAGGDPALDAISAESTHFSLKPPPKRPDVPDPLEATRPDESAAASQPQIEPAGNAPAAGRLWPFWVSGLGAALLSAGLTWYLTGPGSRRPVAPAASVDLLRSEADYPDLVLPAGSAPESEPAPAGEDAPPTAPAGERAPAEPAEAGHGEIALASEPPGADVYIAKKLIGQTPLTLRDLSTEQDLRVELRLAGHAPLKKHIKWRGKTSLDLKLKLKPEGEGPAAAGSSPEGGAPEGKSESNSEGKSQGKSEAKPPEGAGTPAAGGGGN
jgi:serine/threonine-protein kinase